MNTDPNIAACNSITCLVGNIVTHLMDIKTKTPRQEKRLEQAMDGIALWERNPLHKLRKELEK